MNEQCKYLLLAFLVTNALFWGLFPHETHCKVVSEISKVIHMNIECPEHRVHLIMGIIFYVLSVYLVQKNSLRL